MMSTSQETAINIDEEIDLGDPNSGACQNTRRRRRPNHSTEEIESFYEIYDELKSVPKAAREVGMSLGSGYYWLKKRLLNKYKKNCDMVNWLHEIYLLFQPTRETIMFLLVIIHHLHNNH